MPKPTTKADLFATMQKERDALEKMLGALSEDQLVETGIVGDWSPKDVMAHLIEWEQMVLRWYAVSQRGETPHVPAEGYKWNQLPVLNQRIYEIYRDHSLADIQALFAGSYQQIRSTAESIPEADLLQRGLYDWMNQNALIAYFNSATGSHYRWARTEIRKGFRAKGTK